MESRAAPLQQRVAPSPKARIACLRQGRGALQVARIAIDRRAGLSAQWERRLEQEKLMDAGPPPAGTVLEVAGLEHLERVCGACEGQLVLLFLYSNACGVCKRVANQEFERMCVEAQRQQARVVFLKHNVFDEWDTLSDVARFHKVKAVPTFLWLEDGALVKRLQLRDIRGLAALEARYKGASQHAMAEDMKRLKDAYMGMLFRSAPGAH